MQIIEVNVTGFQFTLRVPDRGHRTFWSDPRNAGWRSSPLRHPHAA